MNKTERYTERAAIIGLFVMVASIPEIFIGGPFEIMPLFYTGLGMFIGGAMVSFLSILISMTASLW